MSRIYEALRRTELEHRSPSSAESHKTEPVEFLQSFAPGTLEFRGAPPLNIQVSRASRLTALTEPKGLGAEKFRALAMRLEHLRQQKDMKSVQVTSGGLHEGKTWLAMNLAVTFAQNSQSKVLLVDGDLHRPAVASRLGLPRLPGISRWWSGPDKDLSGYVYQVTGLSLWILPAGTAYEQPSNILRSVRFAEALFSLQGTFDWILVDSPPLLPFVDANLWSRLTDGMLLVVRENVTSLNALKKGLEAIDNLNVIGSVFNDARELEPHKRDDLAGR